MRRRRSQYLWVIASAQTTPEDTPLAIAGVSVNDVDGPGVVLTTTLSVPAGNGTIGIASTAGVTVTGDGSRIVTISGTAAAINAAIATITYTPVADYYTGSPAPAIILIGVVLATLAWGASMVWLARAMFANH